MIDLAMYRHSVFSAPAPALVHSEGGSGRTNPLEVLDWRRSG
jgi:hypothetical protein